jgi:hypothetical protein
MPDVRIRTEPSSSKERQIHSVIQRHRIRRVQERWAILRWAPLFQSKWFELLFKRLDPVPPAPVKKNIQLLWNAYCGDLQPGDAPPELIIELVTLLYGEKVVQDLDVQNMLSRNYWRSSDANGAGASPGSFQEVTLKELATLLPGYES